MIALACLPLSANRLAAQKPSDANYPPEVTLPPEDGLAPGLRPDTQVEIAGGGFDDPLPADPGARFYIAAAGCDLGTFRAAQRAFIADLARRIASAAEAGDIELRETLLRQQARVESTAPPACGTMSSITGLWRVQNGDQATEWRVEEAGSNIRIMPNFAPPSEFNTMVGVRSGTRIVLSFPSAGGYDCPRGAPTRDVPDAVRIDIADDGQSMTQWVRNFDVNAACEVTMLDWRALRRFERVAALVAPPPQPAPVEVAAAVSAPAPVAEPSAPEPTIAVPPNRPDGPRCQGFVGRWRPDSSFSGRIEFFRMRHVRVDGRPDLVDDGVVRGVSGHDHDRFIGRITGDRYTGRWLMEGGGEGTIDIRLSEDARSYAGMLVRGDGSIYPISGICSDNDYNIANAARMRWSDAERRNPALIPTAGQ